MTASDQRKLEDIAGDMLDSFPIFVRRVSRERARRGMKKLDPSRFVLRAVYKHGPVRMSEIGKHMGISKPYMTLLVNKLIDEGLVERVPDTQDRRVVNVTITDSGRDAIREFMSDAKETVVRNLSSLDSSDISSLHEAMKTIRSVASKLDRNETRKCKLG